MKHEFESGTIYNGDCLDLMPEIPPNTADMILADLPYGTTACHWDVIIPFVPLWNNYKRIIKPNGAIVLMASQPFTSALVMSNIKWFKYECVWDKVSTVGFLNAKKMPLRSIENILIFYNNQPIYNPQGIKKINKKINNSKKAQHIGGKNISAHNGGKLKKSFIQEFTNYPNQIIKINRNNKDSGLHPTQKPTKLFEYLIRTYTNEGDTVLDNTIGSGTTAVAAYNTKRKWIGMEKDKSIYQSAVARIKKDTAQMMLF